MLDYAGAVFLVIAFVFILEALKLPARAGEVVAISQGSLGTLRDPALSDAEKEKSLQRHAVRLFALFFQLALGGAAALLLPAGVIWLLDRAGVVSFDGVIGVASSWTFILASTLVVVLVLWRRATR